MTDISNSVNDKDDNGKTTRVQPQTTEKLTKPKNSILESILPSENIIFLQYFFLKSMACIYLVAFLSLYHQIPALYGEDGLLPVSRFLKQVKAQLGNNSLSILPTIFWFAKDINQFIIKIFNNLIQFSPEDNLFHILCLVNAILALAAILDKKNRIFVGFITYFIMWYSYLSIVLVGQTFLSFQWDILLLEAGFLTMFFIPAKIKGNPYSDEQSVLIRELLKWLLFRLMFASGVVKLTSNCPTWWSLTALHTHFESQPLPTYLARYAHFLPDVVKKFMTAGTFIVEIFVPIFFYSPLRNLRICAGILQIILQISIILTGNYNFFNILTSILAIILFDDDFLLCATPNFIKKAFGLKHIEIDILAEKRQYLPHKIQKSTLRLFLESFIQWAIILFILFAQYFPWSSIVSGKLVFDMKYLKNNIINSYYLHYSLYAALGFGLYQLIRHSYQLEIKYHINFFVKFFKIFQAFSFFIWFFLNTLGPFFQGIEANMNTLPISQDSLKTINSLTSSLHITSPYGLFRRITGVDGRPELIIKGSIDGIVWKDYEFYYKPGNITRPNTFLIPHQPRLDWQMWFAALSEVNQNPWLINMISKLFQNNPNIMTLIQKNPFESTSPPKYLQILKYKYSFANLDSLNVWRILNKKNPELYLDKINHDNPSLSEYLRQMDFRAMNSPPYPIHPFYHIPITSICLGLLATFMIWNILKRQ